MLEICLRYFGISVYSGSVSINLQLFVQHTAVKYTVLYYTRKKKITHFLSYLKPDTMHTCCIESRATIGPPANPFKSNGFPQSYQTEQFISVLRVAGCYFSFYSNFNRTFCRPKQTVETLIRRRVLRHLIWF